MYSLGPDLLLSSSKKNKEINLKTREFANLESRSHAFDNLEEDLMDLTRDILDTDANFSRFKVGIRKGSNRIGIGNHLENSKSAVSLERSQSAISWLHSEREKAELKEIDRQNRIAKARQVDATRRAKFLDEYSQRKARDQEFISAATGKAFSKSQDGVNLIRSQPASSSSQPRQLSTSQSNPTRNVPKAAPNSDLIIIPRDTFQFLSPSDQAENFAYIANSSTISHSRTLSTIQKSNANQINRVKDILEQLHDNERKQRLLKGKEFLEQQKMKRKQKLAELKKFEEDQKLLKAERLAKLEEESRKLARAPSPYQARLKLATSRNGFLSIQQHRSIEPPPSKPNNFRTYRPNPAMKQIKIEDADDNYDHDEDENIIDIVLASSAEGRDFDSSILRSRSSKKEPVNGTATSKSELQNKIKSSSDSRGRPKITSAEETNKRANSTVFDRSQSSLESTVARPRAASAYGKLERNRTNSSVVLSERSAINTNDINQRITYRRLASAGTPSRRSQSTQPPKKVSESIRKDNTLPFEPSRSRSVSASRPGIDRSFRPHSNNGRTASWISESRPRSVSLTRNVEKTSSNELFFPRHVESKPRKGFTPPRSFSIMLRDNPISISRRVHPRTAESIEKTTKSCSQSLPSRIPHTVASTSALPSTKESIVTSNHDQSLLDLFSRQRPEDDFDLLNSSPAAKVVRSLINGNSETPLDESQVSKSDAVISMVNKNFENVQLMLQDIDRMTAMLRQQARDMEAQAALRDSLNGSQLNQLLQSTNSISTQTQTQTVIIEQPRAPNHSSTSQSLQDDVFAAPYGARIPVLDDDDKVVINDDDDEVDIAFVSQASNSEPSVPPIIVNPTTRVNLIPTSSASYVAADDLLMKHRIGLMKDKDHVVGTYGNDDDFLAQINIANKSLSVISPAIRQSETSSSANSKNLYLEPVIRHELHGSRIDEFEISNAIAGVEARHRLEIERRKCDLDLAIEKEKRFEEVRRHERELKLQTVEAEKSTVVEPTINEMPANYTSFEDPSLIQVPETVASTVEGVNQPIDHSIQYWNSIMSTPWETRANGVAIPKVAKEKILPTLSSMLNSAGVNAPVSYDSSTSSAFSRSKSAKELQDQVNEELRKQEEVLKYSLFVTDVEQDQFIQRASKTMEQESAKTRNVELRLRHQLELTKQKDQEVESIRAVVTSMTQLPVSIAPQTYFAQIQQSQSQHGNHDRTRPLKSNSSNPSTRYAQNDHDSTNFEIECEDGEVNTEYYTEIDSEQRQDQSGSRKSQSPLSSGVSVDFELKAQVFDTAESSIRESVDFAESQSIAQQSEIKKAITRTNRTNNSDFRSLSDQYSNNFDKSFLEFSTVDDIQQNIEANPVVEHTTIPHSITVPDHAHVSGETTSSDKLRRSIDDLLQHTSLLGLADESLVKCRSKEEALELLAKYRVEMNRKIESQMKSFELKLIIMQSTRDQRLSELGQRINQSSEPERFAFESRMIVEAFAESLAEMKQDAWSNNLRTMKEQSQYERIEEEITNYDFVSNLYTIPANLPIEIDCNDCTRFNANSNQRQAVNNTTSCSTQKPREAFGDSSSSVGELEHGIEIRKSRISELRLKLDNIRTSRENSERVRIMKSDINNLALAEKDLLRQIREELEMIDLESDAAYERQPNKIADDVNASVGIANCDIQNVVALHTTLHSNELDDEVIQYDTDYEDEYCGDKGDLVQSSRDSSRSQLNTHTNCLIRQGEFVCIQTESTAVYGAELPKSTNDSIDEHSLPLSASPRSQQIFQTNQSSKSILSQKSISSVLSALESVRESIEIGDEVEASRFESDYGDSRQPVSEIYVRRDEPRMLRQSSQTQIRVAEINNLSSVSLTPKISVAPAHAILESFVSERNGFDNYHIEGRDESFSEDSLSCDKTLSLRHTSKVQMAGIRNHSAKSPLSQKTVVSAHSAVESIAETSEFISEEYRDQEECKFDDYLGEHNVESTYEAYSQSGEARMLRQTSQSQFQVVEIPNQSSKLLLSHKSSASAHSAIGSLEVAKESYEGENDFDSYKNEEHEDSVSKISSPRNDCGHVSEVCMSHQSSGTLIHVVDGSNEITESLLPRKTQPLTQSAESLLIREEGYDDEDSSRFHKNDEFLDCDVLVAEVPKQSTKSSLLPKQDATSQFAESLEIGCEDDDIDEASRFDDDNYEDHVQSVSPCDESQMLRQTSEAKIQVSEMPKSSQSSKSLLSQNSAASADFESATPTLSSKLIALEKTVDLAKSVIETIAESIAHSHEVGNDQYDEKVEDGIDRHNTTHVSEKQFTVPSVICMNPQSPDVAAAISSNNATQHIMRTPTAIFKSPDGTEFASKSAWRKFMMATYFSFVDLSNEALPLVKKPNEVAGQAFEISRCENCVLVLMDHSEQVQIDDLIGCRVFVGACTSSIFIRNSRNCEFYTCSRQLRLREVENCSLFVFSMSEVHIESSSRLSFGCFHGGYPEQSTHFEKAKLKVSQNLWYDIFDHSDPAKSHTNWRIMDDDEYGEAWFPTGQPCIVAVDYNKPGTTQKHEQVSGMQSFSIYDTKPSSSEVADVEVVAKGFLGPSKEPLTSSLSAKSLFSESAMSELSANSKGGGAIMKSINSPKAVNQQKDHEPVAPTKSPLNIILANSDLCSKLEPSISSSANANSEENLQSTQPTFPLTESNKFVVSSYLLESLKSSVESDTSTNSTVTLVDSKSKKSQASSKLAMSSNSVVLESAPPTTKLISDTNSTKSSAALQTIQLPMAEVTKAWMHLHSNLPEESNKSLTSQSSTAVVEVTKSTKLTDSSKSDLSEEFNDYHTTLHTIQSSIAACVATKSKNSLDLLQPNQSKSNISLEAVQTTQLPIASMEVTRSAKSVVSSQANLPDSSKFLPDEDQEYEDEYEDAEENISIAEKKSESVTPSNAESITESLEIGYEDFDELDGNGLEGEDDFEEAGGMTPIRKEQYTLQSEIINEPAISNSPSPRANESAFFERGMNADDCVSGSQLRDSTDYELPTPDECKPRSNRPRLFSDAGQTHVEFDTNYIILKNVGPEAELPNIADTAESEEYSFVQSPLQTEYVASLFDNSATNEEDFNEEEKNEEAPSSPELSAPESLCPYLNDEVDTSAEPEKRYVESVAANADVLEVTDDLEDKEDSMYFDDSDFDRTYNASTSAPKSVSPAALTSYSSILRTEPNDSAKLTMRLAKNFVQESNENVDFIQGSDEHDDGNVVENFYENKLIDNMGKHDISAPNKRTSGRRSTLFERRSFTLDVPFTGGKCENDAEVERDDFLDENHHGDDSGENDEDYNIEGNVDVGGYQPTRAAPQGRTKSVGISLTKRGSSIPPSEENDIDSIYDFDSTSTLEVKSSLARRNEFVPITPEKNTTLGMAVTTPEKSMGKDSTSFPSVIPPSTPRQKTPIQVSTVKPATVDCPLISAAAKIFTALDMNSVLFSLNDPDHGDANRFLPELDENEIDDDYDAIVYDRMDEIIRDLYILRHKTPTTIHPGLKYAGSFPKRYFAELLRKPGILTEALVCKEVYRRLEVDQVKIDSIKYGRKHVLELVKVDTLERYLESVSERMYRIEEIRR